MGATIDGSATDYVYDVFISYRREHPNEALLTPWIHNVVRLMTLWLREELGGRKPRLFFDTETMEVGELFR
jgi:hypothetical protein